MTFQEKYGESYKEAQKVLRDAFDKVDEVALAELTFKAICDEIETEIKDIIDIEKNMRLGRHFLGDYEIRLPIEVTVDRIRVEKQVINCHSKSRGIRLTEDKQKIFKEILAQKLDTVGIKLKVSEFKPYKNIYASLTLKSNSDI